MSLNISGTTSGYSSQAPISFGGLASGLDTNSIISQLVQIERQPITQLQSQIQNYNSQKGILSDLTTKLDAFNTAVGALSTASAVQGRTATVASGAPFTATVSGAAPIGNYSIAVSQLAQAQRTYSNAYSGPDTASLFANGTINIGVGGSNATISVDGTDTLNTVASKINSTGLNVNAAVVYDGTNYRLVVNGTNSGSHNAISFTDSGTGLGLDVAANTVVAAQDAHLTVDGLAVTSATNVVSGSIPGVSLNLTGTSGTAYSLGVTSDPSRLENSLKAIATAYNAVMGVVNQQFPQAGSTTQLGPNTLVGDPTIGQLQNSLLGIPTITGGPAGNTFSNLAQIGVTVDRYGTMSVDTSKLESALSTDSTAVTNLIVGDNATDGLVTQIGNLVNTYTDYVSGLLPSESQAIDSTISSLNDNISRLDVLATAYQQNLQNEFNATEQLIGSFNNQGSLLSQYLGTGNTSHYRLARNKVT